MQRTWVRSLVGALRSYMLRGVAKKKKKIWLSSYREVAQFIREGNGTPLQYSCLENLMDGEAWWAAVHGVTKSRT